jgi:hypothetical protein
LEYTVSKYGNDDKKRQALPVSFFGGNFAHSIHTYTSVNILFKEKKLQHKLARRIVAAAGAIQKPRGSKVPEVLNLNMCYSAMMVYMIYVLPSLTSQFLHFKSLS